MNYFFWLIVLYGLYLIAALIIAKGKLISPSVVTMGSFLAMLLLAYSFESVLGFEVSKKTFEIFSVAGCLFLIPEAAISRIRIISQKGLYHYSAIEKTPIRISKRVYRVFVALMFVSLILAFVVLFQNSGGGSFSARMESYKKIRLYGDVKHGFITNQLYKIDKAVAYFVAYIVTYNWACCKVSPLKNKNALLIIALYAIFSFVLQAARQHAIEILLYIVLVYLLLISKEHDIKKILRVVSRIIPIVVVGVFVFYNTMALAGRRQSERDVLEYFAVYFCGGLYAFNLHVDEPARSMYWGQSSFSEVYAILAKLNLVPKEAVASYHGFELYGNTVTMYGRWYEDFGAAGVYLMVLLVSAVFSIALYKRVQGRRRKPNHLASMLYCMCLISLVWAGYDDRIRPLFSTTTIIVFLSMAILEVVFVEKKIKFII